MRRTIKHGKMIVVGILSTLLVAHLSAVSQADTASGPSLVISQVKITSSNGQFVTLYNPTNTELDMSKYQYTGSIKAQGMFNGNEGLFYLQ